MSIAPNAFIFNVFLSVVNQLLSIKKPQWHSTNVTPRRVVFWSLVILISFLIVLLDWVCVFGVEPVRCAYQNHHILALGISYYTMFASSAFLIRTIQAKTRPDPPSVATLFVNSPVSHSPQSIEPFINKKIKIIRPMPSTLRTKRRTRSSTRYKTLWH